MTTARGSRWIAGLFAVALVTTGCSRGDDDASDTTLAGQPVTVTQPEDPIVTVNGDTTTGTETNPQLGMQLTEGDAASEVVEPVELTTGTPLDPDDVDSILAELPPWNLPADDESEFELPPGTLLPPPVGGTVDQPFPPPGDAPGPPADPAGPLEVLRFQPEGDVGVAPFVTATFSEPMVPIATLDQLDAADVPMSITPQVEGRFRWIGTRTLRFEALPGEIDRLPAATAYEVVIPAGTESANGAVLDEEVRWTFATPPATLLELTGVNDSMPTDAVWVATFDQRVDAAAVLDAITVDADGDEVELRLADDDDLERSDAARLAMEAALADRAVAFTAATELPTDTEISIEVGPDVPSAEGPLTSPDVERFTGRTFGALEIVRSSCSWERRCTPGAPFIIEFSNELDPDLFDAASITVEPAIPGLHIDMYGNVVELRGTTKGQTSYTVTFDAALADVYGQSLGEDATVRFDVGSARPELRGLRQTFITTDPMAEQPSVSITTINHDAVRVRAWAVTPAQLPEFYDYLDRLWSNEDATDPGWDVVMDESVEIDNVTDTYVETEIDLSEPMQVAGHEVVVRVDSELDINQNDDDYWANHPTVSWVQHTTLGLDAFLDNDELVIATNDLVTGEPVGGVPVELLGDGRVATTDEDGLAELELGGQSITGLFANAGDRTALLPAEQYGEWRASSYRDESRWYVIDDRGVYRPGETVHLTGWVRHFTTEEAARLELYGEGATLEYTATDAQGVELATGTAELSPLGGFTIDIDLPLGTNLGAAYVELRLEAGDLLEPYAHTFMVQEFRRPEFEVTTTVATPPPYFDSGSATVAVDAAYFSGAPLPGAEVSWLVATQETTYAPPDWDDYTFGVWQPWWWYGEDVAFAAEPAMECFDCGPVMGEVEYEEYSGRTDADGTHRLQIGFDGAEVDLPSSVTAEATVFDVNRQAWSSRSVLLVHPAELYVGLRSERAFVEPGTPLRLDAVVTDVDGTIAPGHPVEVTAGRLEWTHTGGEWTEELVDTQTCTFTSTDDPTDEAMRCEFATEVGGTYRISAIVTDPAGQTSRSEITQWVSGGTSNPSRTVEQERVTIVPDRESYAPGDTAELLVQAPFAPAYGTFTVVHHGIVTTAAFAAEDGSAVLEIPIDDAYVPNVIVQVDMNGATTRTDDAGNPRDDLPLRTAFATGQIDLPVPPESRTLDVTVTPAATELTPGSDTSVTVAVADATGEPVSGAEVAVLVVDEAVLSLTGYELTDPIDVFYRTLMSSMWSRYYRSRVLLFSGVGDGAAGSDDSAEESAEEPAAEEPSAAGDFDSGARANAVEGSEILLRSDFDPVAVYAPGQSTAADGTVTVDVALPDSLTRYRVMAVAVDGADEFGKGEAAITARLPLMVQASAPRFLNFGDRFELPIVLHNQTDEPLEIDVAVETANLELLDGAGRRVTVPASNRVEVRFPATTVEAGIARLRIAAVSGTFSDAAEFSLPVYTPATSEAFATYGVIDDEAIAQPLVAPTGVIPAYGGLEIGTASTALQALTDAVLYVVDYAYESSDAYASRIIAVASLRDVLEAFDAEGLPSPQALDTQVASDIARLAALQNDDGGFPYWQRGRESIPWNSIQSTHALVLAQQEGYTVPAATLDAALEFLAAIEAHTPADYSQDLKWTLSAYALYVRDLAGDGDSAKAEKLYDTAGDDLQLDALAWLWPSIVDPDTRSEIETRFTNSAVETAGAATFATDYAEDAYLIAQSDTRTDAIILDALITETPESDLIPKVVAGLNVRRQNGCWNNDQENSFALVAMKRYFDTFEASDPDFVARAWIGDTFVAESSFVDRTTERVNTVIPTDVLTTLVSPEGDLILSKDGAGRLYYRLGLTYAPADLRLDARDEGFVVERTYLPVADDGDVTRDADGTWRIKAGATVRVRVTMVADARRTHVALLDPLPAGLEPINSGLDVSQTIPPEDEEPGDGAHEPRESWWWNWYEHENLRDDRAEAFATYLDGGTYEYTYLARATTPGTFVTPPTRAEQVYAPEVFGRTATDTVVVE